MRIDPNLQRNLSQPPSTAPELSPEQCRWKDGKKREVPSCYIYNFCTHDSIKPQASNPLIGTDRLEGQRDFFS